MRRGEYKLEEEEEEEEEEEDEAFRKSGRIKRALKAYVERG